jgi:hypothetical protein
MTGRTWSARLMATLNPGRPHRAATSLKGLPAMRKMLPLLIAIGFVFAAVVGVRTISSSLQPTAAAHARVAAVAAVKAPAQTAPAAAVKVVMRDPGCHWFAVGAKFKTKLAVSGTAKLANLDEATLKIKGAGSVKRVNVGRTAALGRGAYTITMVGQKPDDNTLHLTVH